MIRFGGPLQTTGFVADFKGQLKVKSDPIFTYLTYSVVTVQNKKNDLFL